MLPYVIWFRRLSDRPHLHGVQGEVFLRGESGAAVGGAFRSGAAVPLAEVTVEPQAEVAVLTAHTLTRTDRAQRISTGLLPWEQLKLVFR